VHDDLRGGQHREIARIAQPAVPRSGVRLGGSHRRDQQGAARIDDGEDVGHRGIIRNRQVHGQVGMLRPARQLRRVAEQLVTEVNERRPAAQLERARRGGPVLSGQRTTRLARQPDGPGEIISIH
jgi:hypothetical protein